MSNQLLIEAGVFEVRVALLEEGRLAEVHHERQSTDERVGDIYKGRVSRVVPGIQAAFVDIGLSRDAFLFAGDIRGENRPIAEEVQQGQELLVQIAKEAVTGKGTRIGLQISLPGRFVVLLPNASGVGISRRVEDPEERLRLETEIEGLLPDDCGVIVRTAGANVSSEALRHEIGQLVEAWELVQARTAKASPPALVHQETSLSLRAVRDLVDTDTDAVWVDGEEVLREVREYLARVDPPMAERLREHRGEESLFDRFGIDAALSRALRTRIWLKSGGFIVINPTEALVAVDVNSGRNTDGIELETTARATNLEAAEEVARQIRLRDLSGIIVVDFIDMLQEEHRQELLEVFEAALARSRARTQISQMSDFGLVAVTRKRMRGGLRQRLTEPCPCCDGEGWVKDPMTLGLEIGREIARRQRAGHGGGLVVEVHPWMKEALQTRAAAVIESLQEEIGGGLELRPNSELPLGEFEIRAG
jgi:ribonuclease G